MRQGRGGDSMSRLSLSTSETQYKSVASLCNTFLTVVPPEVPANLGLLICPPTSV